MFGYLIRIILDRITELEMDAQINLIKIIPNDILMELFSHLPNDEISKLAYMLQGAIDKIMIKIS